jgi:hypothetical protein
MNEILVFDELNVNSNAPETLEINYLNTVLHNFEEISLEEMNEVKMLNRFDLKYCMHTTQLQKVMEEIYNDYFILKIDGTRIQSYISVYFDTPDDLFYITHHNGISKRIKIRKREYVDSGIYFTEIKLKSNKGKTNKKRIPAFSISHEITPAENQFISNTTNQKFKNLTVKSTNSFNRITLVGKNFNERCTIDINIVFPFADKNLLVQNMVVVELKQGSRNLKSKLSDTLKRNKVYKLGFSKYCMSRALTEKHLKKNALKPKILKITKQFNLVMLD